MVERQTYDELELKWRILSGHPGAHIASHDPYPKSISMADMAVRMQESLDMTSGKNQVSLSISELFKGSFYKGYLDNWKLFLIKALRHDDLISP